MDKLIFEVRRHETATNVLAKIKDMYKNGRYSYFAGSLTVNVPDLIKNDSYCTVNIKPIDEITCDIEREIMYYASLMYEKHKGKTCCFYDQAVKNIEEYKELCHN